ncbi:MAG: polysaccharide biosynthesis protein GtrA [Clostridiales bacterium]|nr:polysaccharide biosynthesis protein GtrA [Clostridiales bacterium]
MNAYDFDKCIYAKDSTLDFYAYCVKKHPNLLRYVWRQGWGFLLYAMGLIEKTAFKERFFSFLQGVDDVGAETVAFWGSHRQHLRSWYLSQRQAGDLIVSASPEFLLQPLCGLLGIPRLIASRVDPKTGRFLGENCYGAEKVRRVREQIDAAEIDAFYSDSLSDQPMADLAKESFLVVKGVPIPWKDYRTTSWQKAKRHFLSFEFLRFLIIGGINTLNGVAFSYLFSLMLTPQVAFVCGYLASLVISYLLNSFFTFHQPLSFGKMMKFFVSYIPHFLIQNAVVYVACSLLGFPPLAGYILAAVIGIPVTFLLLKLFTFRSKPKQP